MEKKSKAPKFTALDPELLTRTDDDFTSDKITLDEYLAILWQPDDDEKLRKLLDFHKNVEFKDVHEFANVVIKPVFHVRPDFLFHPIFNNIDVHEFEKSLEHRLETMFQFGSIAIIKGFLTETNINIINGPDTESEAFNSRYLFSILQGLCRNVRDGKLMEYMFRRFDSIVLSNILHINDFCWIYNIQHPETLTFILDKVLNNCKWLDRDGISYQKLYIMSNICFRLDSEMPYWYYFRSPLGIEVLRILLERGFPLKTKKKELIDAFNNYINEGNNPIDITNEFNVFESCLSLGNIECLQIVLKYYEKDLKFPLIENGHVLFRYISRNKKHGLEIWRYFLDRFGIDTVQQEMTSLFEFIESVPGENVHNLISIAAFLNMNIKLPLDKGMGLLTLLTFKTDLNYNSKFYRYLKWRPFTAIYFTKDFKEMFLTVLLCINIILPDRRTQWKDLKWILGDKIRIAHYYDRHK